MKLNRIASVTIATGLLVGGGGAAYAAGAAPSQSAHARPEHSEITLLLQRGEITAVSPTSITLVSSDGYSHTYVIDAKTKVRAHQVVAPVGTLKVGGRARLVARRTASGDVAKRINARS